MELFLGGWEIQIPGRKKTKTQTFEFKVAFRSSDKLLIKGSLRRQVDFIKIEDGNNVQF